jgi:L-alanine-DL-glutamate epimerase-like enolase superfamily enzyme
MADELVGRDAREVEAIWRRLFNKTHANSIGPVVNLALAAIDIALWDIRCQRAGQPLWLLAGGARRSTPVYDTEGGWLHLSADELVANAVEVQRRGWPGFKMKVGSPRAHEDVARLRAVRDAVGPGLDIMVDANQAFTLAEAQRRARLFEPYDVYWFEEPMPAEDLGGHARLAAATSIPIAVGESIYVPSHFREYLSAGACHIVQPDVARIGGITPWLKVAHLAESFNVGVAPHFLMELATSLTAAVPNALYVEHIPQLRALTCSDVAIEDGAAVAPMTPGVGIEWDLEALVEMRVPAIQTNA